MSSAPQVTVKLRPAVTSLGTKQGAPQPSARFQTSVTGTPRRSSVSVNARFNGSVSANGSEYNPQGVGNDFYEAFRPLWERWGDPNQHLYYWCLAMGHILQPIDDLVMDFPDQTGYSQILNLWRAKDEWLKWLGQWVGYQVTDKPAAQDKSAWSLEQRAKMRTRSPLRRGTAQIIKEVVAETLSTNDPNRVIVRERDGGPHLITVITFTKDTPNPTATQAAARSQKAAGLIMTYLTQPGQDYSLFLNPISLPTQTYAQNQARYTNYESVRRDVP